MTASALAGASEAGASAKPVISVVIGRLAPIHGSEDQLVALAAAAAPVGSHDPADRAILQLAAAMGDMRHFQQVDVQPATPQTKMSVATVRSAAGGGAAS